MSEVDPQQELYDPPIFGVSPYDGDCLIAVFRRGVGVEGTTIHTTGFNAPLDRARYPFTVDLRTGTSENKPYRR